MQTYQGRFSATHDGDIVVFLIGMRFLSLRALPTAFKTFARMPKMLAELDSDPSLGCLGSSFTFVPWGATITQYWKSTAQLGDFARKKTGSHLAAWQWFNALGRTSHGVGVWHESYYVAAGASESMYVNMPRIGLAAAVGHRAVGQPKRTSLAEVRVGDVAARA